MHSLPLAALLKLIYILVFVDLENPSLYIVVAVIWRILLASCIGCLDRDSITEDAIGHLPVTACATCFLAVPAHVS